MKAKNLNSQRGFAHLLLIIILMAGVVGIAAFAFLRSNELGGGNHHQRSVEGWKRGCTSQDKVSLTHLPMNLEDVQSVTPYGLTAGAHVTPIDHLYLYPKGKERDAVPVYAMADGYIKEISERKQSTDSGQAKPGEFRLMIQHSCQTFTYFDLITSLDTAIKDQWKGRSDLHIPVKGGQVVGRIGGQTLDTAVYNLNLTLPGFITPSMYDAEPWKIHTDDFFEYFVEPLRSQLLSRNPRKVKPLSGKIDYDQPGKLVGNWFLENTNGYGGLNGEGPGKDGHGYWDGHLAIFYDAYDGKTVVVSVGMFGPGGQPQAFAVIDNKPDPAEVSSTTGLVKYELLQHNSGIGPDGKPNPPQQAAIIKGVALFQVMDGEKLKVELFPGKSGAQITGFTSAAQTYER
jgi:hypothetical protein